MKKIKIKQLVSLFLYIFLSGIVTSGENHNMARTITFTVVNVSDSGLIWDLTFTSEDLKDDESCRFSKSEIPEGIAEGIAKVTDRGLKSRPGVCGDVKVSFDGDSDDSNSEKPIFYPINFIFSIINTNNSESVADVNVNISFPTKTQPRLTWFVFNGAPINDVNLQIERTKEMEDGYFVSASPEDNLDCSTDLQSIVNVQNFHTESSPDFIESDFTGPNFTESSQVMNILGTGQRGRIPFSSIISETLDYFVNEVLFYQESARLTLIIYTALDDECVYPSDVFTNTADVVSKTLCKYYYNNECEIPESNIDLRQTDNGYLISAEEGWSVVIILQVPNEQLDRAGMLANAIATGFGRSDIPGNVETVVAEIGNPIADRLLTRDLHSLNDPIFTFEDIEQRQLILSEYKSLYEGYQIELPDNILSPIIEAQECNFNFQDRINALPSDLGPSFLPEMIDTFSNLDYLGSYESVNTDNFSAYVIDEEQVWIQPNTSLGITAQESSNIAWNATNPTVDTIADLFPSELQEIMRVYDQTLVIEPITYNSTTYARLYGRGEEGEIVYNDVPLGCAPVSWRSEDLGGS